jgi:disulfide oxidoreductase YuzD
MAKSKSKQPSGKKSPKKKAKAKKWDVATDLATNTLVTDIQAAMESEGLNAPSAEEYYEELENKMAAKLEAQGLKPAAISHVKILNEENVEDQFDKMMLGIDEYLRPELVIARNSGHEPVFRIHYKEDTWTMSNTAPTWKYKIEFHQNVCVLYRKTGKTSFKFQIDYLNFWDAGEIVKALINPIASEDKIGFMGHMIKPFEVPLEILKAQADQSEAAEEDHCSPGKKRRLLI